jgi:molecular chaperone GrpE
MRSTDDESQGPVIRDRRRIDPVTGRVRGPGSAAQGQQNAAASDPGRPGPDQAGGPAAEAAGASPGGGAQDDHPAAAAGPAQHAAAGSNGGRGTDAAVMLAERTADLQRLQAEYANYRKRVERDRQAVREQALASVLGQLLPVLDDIGRAREHGELVGGFKQVAEALEAAAAKLGLTTYGEAGDPFDPTLNEALMHSYSADVSEPACVTILQPGYKVGERILRPARVAVAEPGDTGDSQSASGQSAGDAGPSDAQSADAGEAGPGGSDPGSPGAPGSDD